MNLSLGDSPLAFYYQRRIRLKPGRRRAGAAMQKKGEHKRQQIISTANELFYQRGFHQTSLADIADACGIPKGNFYFYFRTKDDILNAVVDLRAERFEDRLKEWEKEYPEPLDRLIRMSEMGVRDWEGIVRYGCPMGTLLLELGKQDCEVKKHARRQFEMILAWTGAQFAALAGPGEARKLARRMLARMQGAAVLANAFSDESWLFDEQRAIAEWLEGLAPEKRSKKGAHEA
jgi:TetR/AcrR family transcriptional repressor of nem operon